MASVFWQSELTQQAEVGQTDVYPEKWTKQKFECFRTTNRHHVVCVSPKCKTLNVDFQIAEMPTSLLTATRKAYSDSQVLYKVRLGLLVMSTFWCQQFGSLHFDIWHFVLRFFVLRHKNVDFETKGSIPARSNTVLMRAKYKNILKCGNVRHDNIWKQKSLAVDVDFQKFHQKTLFNQTNSNLLHCTYFCFKLKWHFNIHVCKYRIFSK
jgi:hypothetical protein